MHLKRLLTEHPEAVGESYLILRLDAGVTIHVVLSMVPPAPQARARRNYGSTMGCDRIQRLRTV